MNFLGSGISQTLMHMKKQIKHFKAVAVTFISYVRNYSENASHELQNI